MVLSVMYNPRVEHLSLNDVGTRAVYIVPQVSKLNNNRRKKRPHPCLLGRGVYLNIYNYMSLPLEQFTNSQLGLVFSFICDEHHSQLLS